MTNLRHGLLLALYLLPAIAVGYKLPDWLPLMDRGVAIAIGLTVLVGGGLVHEFHARRERDRRVRGQILELRRAFFHLQDELTWSRRQLRSLGEALEAVARSGRSGRGRGGRGIEEVMAEVSALRALVEKAQGAEAGVELVEAADEERLVAAAGGPAALAGPREAARSEPRHPPLMLVPLPQEASEEDVLETVRRALRDDRVDLVLQPVVALPQRKARYLEAYSRLHRSDGTVLLPEVYIPLAEREGHVTAIDNMLLLRCIQLVRRIQVRGDKLDVFCNISSHTLRDRGFFEDFADFLESNDDLAPHLIFEFTQNDFEAHGAEEAAALERLSLLGCRFSLDQVSDLEFDPRSLTGRRVSFVKVEAGVLLEAAKGDEAAVRALKRGLAAQGIELIAEKVESEAALLELLDHDLDFGQGFLFGAPRAPGRKAG